MYITLYPRVVLDCLFFIFVTQMCMCIVLLIYQQNIPNIAAIDSELFYGKEFGEQPTERFEIRIVNTLQVIDKHTFVYGYILQLLATIPITLSLCEKSISTIRYLKNCLRRTVGQQRLHGLALMYFHREIYYLG